MTALWEKADLIVTGSRVLSREEKEFTVVSFAALPFSASLSYKSLRPICARHRR